MESSELKADYEIKKIEVRLAEMAEKIFSGLQDQLPLSPDKDGVTDLYLAGKDGLFESYDKAHDQGGVLDITKLEVPDLTYNKEDLVSFRLSIEAIISVLDQTNKEHPLQKYFEYSSRLSKIMAETNRRLDRLEKPEDGEEIAA